ncbi:MAG: hypothetical protein OEZ40_11645 [Candidatus Bathyarchaeota archaeon]|nr:hypothetical protein [Candidatus Bathyarchaeota archaeon]
MAQKEKLRVACSCNQRSHAEAYGRELLDEETTMKTTTVTRIKKEDGTFIIEGNCDFCGQFPCKCVTEQGYWVEDHQWRLNSKAELLLIRSALEERKASLEHVLRMKRRRGRPHKSTADIVLSWKRELGLANWLLNEVSKLEEGWSTE